MLLLLQKEIKKYEKLDSDNKNNMNRKFHIKKSLLLQEKEQLEYINKKIFIPNNIISLDINPDVLYKVVSDYYYNPLVMAKMSKIVMSFNWSGKIASNNQLIHVYFNPNRVLGTGNYGKVLSVGVIKPNPLLAVKIFKNYNERQEIHEIAIGLKLNSLRGNTINFAYMYGFYNCSPQDGEIDNFCLRNNYTNYFICYENIPGETLFDSLDKLSIREIYSIYLQICYALKIAYEKFKYTHYDLHTKNIILRPTNKKILFFEFEDSTRKYIETNGYVATIIDYGMSFISDNSNWGIPLDLPLRSCLSRHDGSIFLDLFKLFCHIYEVYPLKDTLSFFNIIPEDLPKLREFRYYIPSSLFSNMSLDDWINKIENKYILSGGYLSSHTDNIPSDLILDCQCPINPSERRSGSLQLDTSEECKKEYTEKLIFSMSEVYDRTRLKFDFDILYNLFEEFLELFERKYEDLISLIIKIWASCDQECVKNYINDLEKYPILDKKDFFNTNSFEYEKLLSHLSKIKVCMEEKIEFKEDINMIDIYNIDIINILLKIIPLKDNEDDKYIL